MTRVSTIHGWGYMDFLSRLLSWLTIFVFPVVIPPFMVFQLFEDVDPRVVTGILLTLCTAGVAYRSMRVIRALRKDRTQPPLVETSA